MAADKAQFQLPKFFTQQPDDGSKVTQMKTRLSGHLHTLLQPAPDASSWFVDNAKSAIAEMATDGELLEITQGQVVYKIVEALAGMSRDESLPDKTRIQATELMVNIVKDDKYTNGDIVDFALDQMRPVDDTVELSQGPSAPKSITRPVSLSDRLVNTTTLFFMTHDNTVRHVSAWAIEDSPVWNVPSEMIGVESSIQAFSNWMEHAQDRKGVDEVRHRATGCLAYFRDNLQEDQIPGAQPDMQQELMHNGFDMYTAIVAGDQTAFRKLRDTRHLAKEYGALDAA